MPRSPTTCAATWSATTSPTSSTATSTSPTSATPAAGSARSPSAAPTPTPTRSPSTRSPTAPRRPGPLGATEVCMQGGIDPELPGTAYFDLAAAVKARVPGMHVHAFSPMEVVNGATRTGLSIRDWLVARQGGRPGHHPRHRRGDPRRRRPLDPDQGQAADRDLGRGGHHRAPAGHPVELDDDVRPRRQPRALGAAPAGAGPDPGRADRRLHRVRAAAVRAHQRADLPRRRRPARPDAARQPGRARDGADPAARPDRQHPDLLGQARRRAAPGRCCGPAPTTSAAR